MLRLLARHPHSRTLSMTGCRHCAGKANTDQQSAKSESSKEVQPMDMVGINFKDIVSSTPKQPQIVKHLNLEKTIRKARKAGSMVRDLFLNMLDPDFLQYPEILKSRHQFNELMKQSRSIDKYFKHLVMRDPEKQIPGFGFHNLWFLTKSEMVNIFESIGQSMAHRIIDYDENEKDANTSDIIIHPIVEPGNVKHMLRLILNNCALACIDSSNNENVRKNFYQKLNEKKDLRVAFCWSESHMRPSMDACEDFKSEVKLTTDKKYVMITAEKDDILADDYDYFLIFARTRDFDSSTRPEYLMHQDVPFDGIATVLVPKELIASSSTYDSNGIEYMRIKVDEIILPIDRYQVLEPEVDGVQANNYKGLVKLSMAALMVGQMKATMRDLNKYLTENKAPLLSCDAVARATSQMVIDIYTSESCLYYSAAMFDQLEKTLYPEIHLEAGLTSIITHNAAESFYANVRELIGTSGKLGPIIDLNIALRDMVETEDFTRVKTVLDGVNYLMEQRSRWFDKFAVSPNIRERSLLELDPNIMCKIRRNHISQSSVDFQPDWDLQGFLHPTFTQEAKTMERIVKVLAYCGEIFISANKGEIAKDRMHDLLLVSELVVNTYKLICSLSRASRSFCETLRNADMDVEMVKMMTDEIDFKINDMMEECEKAAPGRRTHRIRANIAEYRRTGKAYYVTDPLDTLHKDDRKFDWLRNIPKHMKHSDKYYEEPVPKYKSPGRIW